MIDQNELFRCKFCNALVKRGNYKKHKKKVHPQPKLVYKTSPLVKTEKELYYETVIQLRAEEERKIELEKNSHYVQIIWDDVIFGNNCVKFDPNRIKIIIKPFPYKGLIEGLNVIKKEYFKRIFSKKIYHLTIFKGEILKELSPGLSKIFSAIEVVKDFYGFKHPSIHNIIPPPPRFTGLSNEEIIELFPSIKKSDYLKFLASKCDPNLKLIPIIEVTNGKREEAFLFRFETKNKMVLLIWENVNEARASHVFAFHKSEQQDILSEIECFVCCDDYLNKRSNLYINSNDARQFKKQLHYKQHIKHDNIDQYKLEIERLIKNL